MLARSEYFKRMFLTNMNEGRTGEVTISDIDEDTMEELINFIYQGELTGKDVSIPALSLASERFFLDSMMNIIYTKMREEVIEDEDLADIIISSTLLKGEKLFELAMDKLKAGKKIILGNPIVKEKLENCPEVLYKILQNM